MSIAVPSDSVVAARRCAVGVGPDGSGAFGGGAPAGTASATATATATSTDEFCRRGRVFGLPPHRRARFGRIGSRSAAPGPPESPISTSRSAVFWNRPVLKEPDQVTHPVMAMLWVAKRKVVVDFVSVAPTVARLR
jgi:hypothetical protein